MSDGPVSTTIAVPISVDDDSAEYKIMLNVFKKAKI